MTEAVLEAGSWIYKMLVTLVLAVIVVALVGMVIRTENNTIDVQRELLFNRILYDPQGLWYVDGNNVMHPGVLDLTAFTQERTNTVFRYPENYGGAKIELLDTSSRDPLYIVPATYGRLETNAKAGITNGGTLVVRTYPVVVRDGNLQRNAWLRITVAMPARA